MQSHSLKMIFIGTDIPIGVHSSMVSSLTLNLELVAIAILIMIFMMRQKYAKSYFKVNFHDTKMFLWTTQF